MNDQRISAHCAIAAALWILGGALVLLGLSFSGASCGCAGIFLGAAAGTINVRGFICRSSERQRDIFQMGRDSADLHSVH